MANFKKEVDKTIPLECNFLEPFASLPIFKQMTVAQPEAKLEYFLVASCPPGSTHRSKCINDESLPDVERLPVIDDKFYIYKNKYCAMCNKVESFVNLNLTVKCTHPVITGQPTVIVTAPPKPSITVPPVPPHPEFTVPTVPPHPEFTIPSVAPHPVFTAPPIPPQLDVTVPPAPSKPEIKAKDLINEFQECLVDINPSLQAPYGRIRKLKCNNRKMLNRICKDPNSYCHLYKSSFAGYQNLHCHQCQNEVFSINLLEPCFTLAAPTII